MILRGRAARADRGASKGKIWRRFVARDELDQVQRRAPRDLHAADRRARSRCTCARTRGPTPRSRQIEPDLEDVYFLAIKRHRGTPCPSRRRRERAMLGAIAIFEARQRLRRLSSIVYFAVYFLAGLLLMMASAGAFKSFNRRVRGRQDPGELALRRPRPRHADRLISPSSITAAVMGQAVYQDFDTGAAPLFFTLPDQEVAVPRRPLPGRARRAHGDLRRHGARLPRRHVHARAGRDTLGPNRIAFYLRPYLVGVLPNLLFMGARLLLHGGADAER